MIAQVYLVVLAFIALIVCSVGYSFYVTYDNNTIARKYFVVAVAYVLCIFLTISTEIVKNDMLKHVLFYFSYFTKYMVLVTLLEIFGYLTGFFDSNRHYVILVTTAFTNIGVIIFIINLLLGGTSLVRGDFGTYFSYYNLFFIASNSIYFTMYMICILYYVIRYRENCVSYNDIFLYNNYVIVAWIIGISMFVEIGVGAVLKSYVPSIVIAEAICIIGIKYLIAIRRSFQYIESDYSEFLKPSSKVSRFVCDAEGTIIYENKRAFVEGIAHGDKYIGRKFNNVFMLDDKDNEFSDEKISGIRECDAVFNENEHYHIEFEHKTDRFGKMFVTLVSASECIDDAKEEVMDFSENDENILTKSKNLIYVSLDDLKEIKTKEFIKMVDKFSRFYSGKHKELFYYNLKGAVKLASELTLVGSEELIGRIESEYLFGSYESIEPLLTELSRQNSTLKALYF